MVLRCCRRTEREVILRSGAGFLRRYPESGKRRRTLGITCGRPRPASAGISANGFRPAFGMLRERHRTESAVRPVPVPALYPGCRANATGQPIPMLCERPRTESDQKPTSYRVLGTMCNHPRPASAGIPATVPAGTGDDTTDAGPHPRDTLLGCRRPAAGLCGPQPSARIATRGTVRPIPPFRAAGARTPRARPAAASG